MISSILFDFYGVFMSDPYNNWLTLNGFERTGIFADIITDLDRGAIPKDEFFKKLSEATGRPVDTKEIHSAEPVADPAVVSVARQLSKQYTLSLLSNASPELRVQLAALEIDTLFDHIFISSEMGLSKPQPEIFEAALERMEVSPEQVVFIDDNPVNVAAARQTGMTSLVYVSPEDLSEQLRAVNVSI